MASNNGTIYGSVNEGKVIGGHDAKEGEVPWMVSVMRSGYGGRSYGPYCGGSIINDQWVVSAAHCFSDSNRPEDYLLVVGTINRNGEGGDSYEVQSIKNHEGFNPGNFDNDIALLKSKSNFLFNEFVAPISLGTEDMCRKPGLMGIVAGFGRTEDGKPIYEDILQIVEIPIISNEECQEWYDSMNDDIINENKLCAGYKDGGKNSCKGDSGGPLYIQNGDERSLCGVVSHDIISKIPSLHQKKMAKLSYFAFLQFFLVEIFAKEIGNYNGTIYGSVNEGKIICGHDAKKGEVSWMVSVMKSGYKHHCGGSIINDQWVVSAAHCFSDSNRPEDYLLVVGTINRNGEGGDSYEVQSIKNHEDHNTENLDNDIALLKSKSNFLFNEFVAPISLGTEDMCKKPDVIGIVAGFGTTEEGKPIYKDILQIVEVPIIDNETCQELYHSDDIVINENQLCAGYEDGGKDSCQGDSGGPLYIQNGDERSLCGVVSFGIGCARPNYPGVYASIGYFLDWIDENIQENS
ncbi:transmembrane protease serine 9-like [Centruroides vittatus]|uniref:transmembrane protease serine 9-like n=1 Tax=Centruroides vittatus TaxID=120091 RepID=UPI00350FFADC